MNTKKLYQLLTIMLIAILSLSACTLTKPQVVSITIDTTNLKMVFEHGEDFTTEGIKVVSTLKDNTFGEVNTSNLKFNHDVDTSIAGEYQVEVVLISNSNIKTEYTVLVNPESVGSVYFAVELFTIGEEYLIEPLKVDFYDGEIVSDVVQRQLHKAGYLDVYSDSYGSYYLSGIVSGYNQNDYQPVYETMGSIPSYYKKSHLNISNDVSIPTQLKNKIIEVGEAEEQNDWSEPFNKDTFFYGFTQDNLYQVGENTQVNSLKAYDLSARSGFGIYLNDASPSDGTNTEIQNGDVITVKFSLFWLSDVDTSATAYNPLFNEVDRTELTIAIANKIENSQGESYSQELNNALELISQFDITNADIDACLKTLNKND